MNTNTTDASRILKEQRTSARENMARAGMLTRSEIEDLLADLDDDLMFTDSDDETRVHNLLDSIDRLRDLWLESE